jgi:hypothetical protein
MVHEDQVVWSAAHVREHPGADRRLSGHFL